MGAETPADADVDHAEPVGLVSADRGLVRTEQPAALVSDDGEKLPGAAPVCNRVAIRLSGGLLVREPAQPRVLVPTRVGHNGANILPWVQAWGYTFGPASFSQRRRELRTQVSGICRVEP
jgi:hypothetical protein